MKSIKTKDLRDKSVADLKDMADQEKASLFATRRDLVFRKVSDTSSLKVRRHNIARIMTVIGEKERAAK